MLLNYFLSLNLNHINNNLLNKVQYNKNTGEILRKSNFSLEIQSKD